MLFGARWLDCRFSIRWPVLRWVVSWEPGPGHSGSLIDYGIDDNFIRSLAQDLKPDSSALFLLVRKAQPERVLAELSHFRGHVLRTSLSSEQEARLQAALSGVVSTPQDTPRAASP